MAKAKVSEMEKHDSEFLHNYLDAFIDSQLERKSPPDKIRSSKKYREVVIILRSRREDQRLLDVLRHNRGHEKPLSVPVIRVAMNALINMGVPFKYISDALGERIQTKQLPTGHLVVQIRR